MPNPSLDQLQRAIKVSEQIAKLEAELATILGSAAEAPAKRAYTKRATSDAAVAPAKKKRKKAKMSPEGLANIIAAQKKRWAKVKREAKKAQG